MSQVEEQNLTEVSNGGHEEILHENTLYAEPIYHVGNFTITNALLNSWLAVIIIILLCLAVKSKAKLIPQGIQNAFEMVVEGFLGIFDSVTGSRAKSMKFFPLVFGFFLFILINNWLGLLPGVGSVGQVVAEHGEKVFVPYMRAGTADLNTTLALAIIGLVASHIFGIVAIGIWKHFNKFINLKVLAEIPKKIFKDPTVIIVNPIKAFVGLIEIIGEIAKVASLSFRLFGNVFAGEVLLASMSAILAWGLPIPFMFLEVLVGLIQALIFAMLILAYLTINTTAEEH
ncbi:MAG: F0F1 ATP synthase subunit A [Patescibacteria group bacterium]|nr:F0F1 ATP synthase subunit A [Patescibacteria group bacterium]MDD4610391.1 F0F1 ATP synthase subunit A [Patescibacteria group bacterium]